MSRRRTKHDNSELGWLILVGATIVGAQAIGKAVGFTAVIIGVAGVILTFVGTRIYRTQKRLGYLRRKYGNEEIVQKIMRHEFWFGQTAEQLIDSRGQPLAVDRKVSAFNTREVWKYERRGVNRYGLRITLDAGVVTATDSKSL